MFKNLKIAVKIGIGFFGILVMVAGLVLFTRDRLEQIDAKVDLVVKDRNVKVRQCHQLLENLNVVSRALRNVAIAVDPAIRSKEAARVNQTRENQSAVMDSLKESIQSPEGKVYFEKVLVARQDFAPLQQKALDMGAAGDVAGLRELLFGDYRKAQNLYMDNIKALIDFQSDLANGDGETAAQLAASTTMALEVAAVGMFLLSMLLLWAITRSIVKPIKECMELADAVSAGRIDTEVTYETKEETGRLKASMACMIEAIRNMSKDAQLLSKAAVEGKLATRADASKHQGEFKAIVQGVNDTLDAVVGPLNVAANYVDRISKGDIPPKITDDYNGDFNSIKQNLNTCVDAVNHMVADAAMLSVAAVEGKLSTRADANKHQGDFRKIVQGVNETLDAVIGPLNVAAKYVDDISKGNIPPKITDTYNGDFNTLKNNLNTCVDAVNALVADAGLLVKAAVEGRLQTRADATKHNGDFAKIVQGVNDTLDAVIGPITEAAKVLESVADRDLTARVQGDYAGDLGRIKSALNTAVENLESALSQVGEATQQVAGASGQISSGSQSLAQGANEQAGSLEEVSASLEEMASMTRQSSDNANAAKTLAGEANEHATTGTDAMARMSTAIVKIKDSSDQTAKIVKTIDEIAMQTNLLALNAAVEAARAGEAGRGFAVVAEEVRNLAQRSAQAAKNTADMIAESVKNAEAGVKISQEVSVSFDKISTSARKVNDLIAEIASASKEQAQGIKEVGTAVSQMDKVTQQNAANAEESASASEELSSQAQELQAMVAQFKIAGSTKVGGGAPKSDKFRQLMDHSKRVSLDDRPNRKISHDQPVAMDAENLTEF